MCVISDGKSIPDVKVVDVGQIEKAAIEKFGDFLDWESIEDEKVMPDIIDFFIEQSAGAITDVIITGSYTQRNDGSVDQDEYPEYMLWDGVKIFCDDFDTFVFGLFYDNKFHSKSWRPNYYELIEYDMSCHPDGGA